MKTLLIAGSLWLLASVLPLGSTVVAATSSDFKIEAPLNRGGPRVTVRVMAEPAERAWAYDLYVITTDDLDQHIAFRNGQPLTPEGVRLSDVNADGFLDVMVVGGKDHRGEDWFKTWLYDPKRKRYGWINAPRSRQDKIEYFRSHWKTGQRDEVTADLVALLKIGMTKDQVAAILERPSRLDDGVTRDGPTEKWIFTISLARILVLTFEEDQLIHIGGG